MLLTLAGWTSPRIAEAFGVGEDTVRLWRSDFARGGARGERGRRAGAAQGGGRAAGGGTVAAGSRAWRSCSTPGASSDAYDARALPVWTGLAVLTLLACFFLMPPPRPDAGFTPVNIDDVWGLSDAAAQAWLTSLIVGLPASCSCRPTSRCGAGRRRHASWRS